MDTAKKVIIALAAIIAIGVVMAAVMASVGAIDGPSAANAGSTGTCGADAGSCAGGGATDAGNIGTTGSGSGAGATSGDVQIVKLSMKGWQYQFDPPQMQAGRPVRLVADNTLTGCMRDIVIPAFGIKKYLTGTDNTIEFTPATAGSYNIACSMNMGRGTIVVVDGSGSAPSVAQTPQPALAAGGSCGMGGSSGGCGCGGGR